MTCYVDDVRHTFGRMVMCHLWSDDAHNSDPQELLEMVDRIGVDRKWIQGHELLSFGKHKAASWVHFDISLAKKSLAIHHGAVLTDRYGPVVHTTRLMLKWAEKECRVDIIGRCKERLAQIENIRSRNPPLQGSLL